VAHKNQFLYYCVDCGNKQYEYMARFARKCRPRCSACGSTFLEVWTKEAADRIATHGAMEREDHARKMEAQNIQQTEG